jgi:hypothetical protein
VSALLNFASYDFSDEVKGEIGIEFMEVLFLK